MVLGSLSRHRAICGLCPCRCRVSGSGYWGWLLNLIWGNTQICILHSFQALTFTTLHSEISTHINFWKKAFMEKLIILDAALLITTLWSRWKWVIVGTLTDACRYIWSSGPGGGGARGQWWREWCLTWRGVTRPPHGATPPASWWNTRQHTRHITEKITTRTRHCLFFSSFRGNFWYQQAFFLLRISRC